MKLNISKLVASIVFIVSVLSFTAHTVSVSNHGHCESVVAGVDLHVALSILSLAFSGALFVSRKTTFKTA